MGKPQTQISPDLAAWIAAQKLFFVATAPLAREGHVNASPKGGDSFRVLAPNEVAYQDYTGSGAETAAHLRENGRIVVMFTAFEGPPQILRLHGRGEVIDPHHPRFAELSSHFPPNAGTRAYIVVKVTRVATSCGFAVPLYEFKSERHKLDEWVAKKGPEGLADYRAKNNRASIDNLPALTTDE